MSIHIYSQDVIILIVKSLVGVSSDIHIYKYHSSLCFKLYSATSRIDNIACMNVRIEVQVLRIFHPSVIPRYLSLAIRNTLLTLLLIC